jgi:hypothetical protein
VVELLDPRALRTLASELPDQPRDRLEYYLSGLTRDTVSAVRGLGSRLAILTESHTGPFLEPGPGAEIDLHRALLGHEVVLFSLNSSVLGQLAAQLGTLVVQDLIAATGYRQADPAAVAGPPALVAIDEFSALRSDNLLALVARGREPGVGVILATQELADLDRAGRGLRDQLLGNTAVKIIHRQEVAESAQAVAQMAGTHPIWDRTISRESGFGWPRPERVTRRQVEQFVVHPNRIKTLSRGEAIVITKVPRAQVRLVAVNPPSPSSPPVRPRRRASRPTGLELDR